MLPTIISTRRCTAPALFVMTLACGAILVTGSSMRAADPIKGDSREKSKTPPQTAVKEASPVTSVASSDGSELPKPPIDEAHPLYLPLQEAYKAREALKFVKDYEADFVKRELLGRRLQATTMKLKLREEPFSVYLKFVDANAGREVIYFQGRNNNQLLIHEAGLKSLVGTVVRAPNAADVMAENRYPVTMIGLKSMLEKVIKQWEEEGKFGEVKTQKYPSAKLPSGEECIAYESLHPTPRNQFKFHITRLWIETKTGLAIRVEQLGFPQKGDKAPPVIEEYTYANLKLNVKLSDIDFDRTNRAYAFP
jgi:Protein of unknown function (DUF1571)